MSGAPRIAVLGSANMDLVVEVPAAPERGETVTGTAFHANPGGKGANQALAARRAGGEVAFLGALGDDDHGARIRTLLAGEGIDIGGVETVDVPTGVASIVVDAAGENSIVVVPGANGTLTALTDTHRARIAESDVLLLQLEVPLGIVVEAAAFARSSGIPALLTPAPARELPDELYRDLDLLVPNQHEAAALAGTDDLDTAVDVLRARGCDVLMTRGSSGARFAGTGGIVDVPAFAVDAIDTTAAGDTFVGAYAVSRASGSDVRPAVRFASAAAALAVTARGASTAIPHRDRIDRFLLDHPE